MSDNDMTMKVSPKEFSSSAKLAETVHESSASRRIDSGDIALKNDLEVGSHFSTKSPDKYGNELCIDRGGMKLILKTRDKDTARDVAMAVMIETGNSEDTVRFLEEARITANLEHPNIVPVHDIGINENGKPYFTMKLLGGETLTSIISKIKEGDKGYQKRYSLLRLLEIFLKICDGVAFAHSKGVLHLDLKPKNIQLGDFGEVLVLDWGLARIKESDSGTGTGQEVQGRSGSDQSSSFLMMDGVAIGTPGYMAPEQAAGKNTLKTERTDIFSLGAILYVILTLEKPLDGDNVQAILAKTMKAEIVRPSLRAPWRVIPKSLEAVTMKAMSKNPEDRYASVQDLKNEIEAFLGGYATAAEHAGIARKIHLRIMRNKASSVSILVLVLAILSIAGIWLNNKFKQYATWGNGIDITPENDKSLDSEWFAHRIIASSWEVSEDGISPLKGTEFNIYYNTPVYGNIAIEFDVSIDRDCDLSHRCEFGIILCGDKRSDRRYDLMLGAYINSIATIQKEKKDRYSVLFKLEPGRTYHVRGEREGELLRLFCDGKLIVEYRDIFHFEGGYAGIYSHGTGKKFSNIKIFKKGVAQLVSPLSTGDELFRLAKASSGERRTENLRAAGEIYTTIAESHPGEKLGNDAILRRAYVKSEQGNYRSALGDVLELEKISDSYDQELLKMQLLVLCGEYSTAPAFFLSMIGKYPLNNSEIFEMLRICLDKLSEEQIPDAEREKFWKLMMENDVTDIFDCSNAKLKSLDFLKNSDIRVLNCRNNQIESLEPLRGMKLVHIDCSGNMIGSLDPLKGMEIESLRCGDNRIESLEALKGMPLKVLFCWKNRISDLSPLNGMMIELLDCGDNLLENLQALGGMPLKKLICPGNQIASLIPLNSSPIESLDVARNKLDSLDGVKEMPLKNLTFDDNRIGSIEAIAGKKIVTLGCSKNNVIDLSPVSGMPLEYLNCSDNPISSLDPLKGTPLNSLICRNCGIESIQALDGSQLGLLDCVENRISSIDISLDKIVGFFCSNNRIEGFETLLANPPKHFIFDSPTISDEYLGKIIGIWDESKKTTQCTNARTLLAIRKGNEKDARACTINRNGRSYLPIPKTLNWNDADLLCKAMNGSLLWIADEDENNWVKNTFDIPLPIWLGGEKDDADGEWKWSSKEAFSYSNWAEFEPNCTDGRENRIIMTKQGQWLDADPAELRTFIIKW